MLRGDADIAGEIAGEEHIATALRLGVYSEAYTARLVEVLGESFPAVRAALGARRFALLIGDFPQETPEPGALRAGIRAQLPQWLGMRLSGTRAPGIADLAHFEWAVAAAFDAADRVALTPASLFGVDPVLWPQLQFGFSPTLRRLSVTSNCVAWWRFACAGAPKPNRWRATCTQQWLVWRQDLAVFYRRLSAAETRHWMGARGRHLWRVVRAAARAVRRAPWHCARACSTRGRAASGLVKAGLIVGASVEGEALKADLKIALRREASGP